MNFLSLSNFSKSYVILTCFTTCCCRHHLKDVIIGKIYFLLVRIKIKNMELEIRRRESTGSGPKFPGYVKTLAKFELMDGAPVRGKPKI
jgi:Vacuolar protein sorting-associated protein 26